MLLSLVLYLKCLYFLILNSDCYFSYSAAILLGVEKEKFENALTTLSTTVDGELKFHYSIRKMLPSQNFASSCLCFFLLPSYTLLFT